jgi:hypothetical protein
MGSNVMAKSIYEQVGPSAWTTQCGRDLSQPGAWKTSTAILIRITFFPDDDVTINELRCQRYLARLMERAAIEFKSDKRRPLSMFAVLGKNYLWEYLVLLRAPLAASAERLDELIKRSEDVDVSSECWHVPPNNLAAKIMQEMAHLMHVRTDKPPQRLPKARGLEAGCRTPTGFLRAHDALDFTDSLDTGTPREPI